MKIRCMITHKDNLWIAMSLDFGLATQANTKKEAMSKLNEQIKEYLSEAMMEDKAFQTQLLKRKGPTSWFIRYYWTLLKETMAHNGQEAFIRNTQDYVSHA